LIGVVALLLLAVLVLPLVLDEAPRRSVSVPQASQSSMPVVVLTMPVVSATNVTAVAKTTPSGALSSVVPVVGRPGVTVASHIASTRQVDKTSFGVLPPKGSETKSAQIDADLSKQTAIVRQPAHQSTRQSTHQNVHQHAYQKTQQTAAQADKQAVQYVVQLGVFRQPDHVAALRKRLQNIGVSVHAETLSSGAIRLRIGPYASRKEAEAVVANLRLNNVGAQLVPLTQ
jgi:DedD protein